MNNMGTLGVIIAILPFVYLMQWVTSCFGQKFIRVRRLNKYLHFRLYYSYIIRVTMQSFLIGLVCCFIALRYVMISESQQTDISTDIWT